MESNRTVNFSRFIRPSSALLMAALYTGWVSTADAACSTTVPTPADGIIAAGTTIENSAADACFDNAVTPIFNNGVVDNKAGAGLTSVGAFTVNAYGKLWNYGAFNNVAGAQFNVAGNGFVRNYQTGVITNSGNWQSIGSARNDGQWINAAGATMREGTLDHYSGAVFTNNGTLSVGESAIFSGATFNNNGTIVDPTPPGLSSIQNQGTFNNNADGSLKIKSFVNSGAMTNAGSVAIETGSRFDNRKTLSNEAGSGGIPAGRIENSGTLDNRAGAVLDNEGQVINNAGAILNNVGTIDNKSGSQMTNAGFVYNTGEFRVRAGSEVSGSGNFIQYAGGTTTVDGTMTQLSVKLTGGDLAGSGQLTSNVIMLGGRVAADGLTIDGNLELLGGSVLTTIGASDFTVLNVLGTAYLSQGRFIFDFGGYIPDIGDSWTFLNGDISGSLDNFLVDIHQQGNIQFDLDIVSGGLRLTAVADPAAVPVPAAVWLFGSALAGLFGTRRFAGMRKS